MKKQVILVGLIALLNTYHLSAEEPCLTNAWSAYNSRNYIEAIEYSEQCIDDFGRRALLIQQRLDSLNINLEYVPENDIQKNRIFNNGLLNDVATACFIKGKSAEYLYKQNKIENIAYKQIAIDAYELANTYNKGRCWDERGWFWSPAEASRERLPIE